MCLPYDKASNVCQVLTLGSAQELWRTVKTNHKHHPFFSSYGRCINGVIYYGAHLDDEYSVFYIIMSFYVRTEKFDMIRLPIEDFWGMLIRYEGKFACLDSYNLLGNDGITLWILEDPEQHQWSYKHFATPFVRSLKRIYKIQGVTDTGEFICVPSKFVNSFFIFYFDPKRNSLRQVEFKGVADEEFRFTNGLGNGRLRGLFTFPNHVENLMSLKF